jgi:hypothetical protein
MYVIPLKSYSCCTRLILKGPTKVSRPVCSVYHTIPELSKGTVVPFEVVDCMPKNVDSEQPARFDRKWWKAYCNGFD